MSCGSALLATSLSLPPQRVHVRSSDVPRLGWMDFDPPNRCCPNGATFGSGRVWLSGMRPRMVVIHAG